MEGCPMEVGPMEGGAWRGPTEGSDGGRRLKEEVMAVDEREE